MGGLVCFIRLHVLPWCCLLTMLSSHLGNATSGNFKHAQYALFDSGMYLREIINTVFECQDMSKFWTLQFIWTHKCDNTKLCMMILLTKLFLFVELAVTLTTVQGRSSFKQFQLKILSIWVKLKLCTVVNYWRTWNMWVYVMISQPWCNPLWLTGLKAPTNQLTVMIRVRLASQMCVCGKNFNVAIFSHCKYDK